MTPTEPAQHLAPRPQPGDRLILRGVPYDVIRYDQGEGGLVVMQADGRTSCVVCKARIPPGREGRRCVRCREAGRWLGGATALEFVAMHTEGGGR